PGHGPGVGPPLGVSSWNDPRIVGSGSPPRALALDGPLCAPAVRLAREHRSGVRGATRGADRRADPRDQGRTPAGRLSQVVGAGRGPDEPGAAGAAARPAALRGALLLLSLVAQARRTARAPGAHPRPHVRA